VCLSIRLLVSAPVHLMTPDSPDRDLRRHKMHRLEQELENATKHVVELENFSMQRQAILSKLQSEYAHFEASSHPASIASARERPLERDYAASRHVPLQHDRRAFLSTSDAHITRVHLSKRPMCAGSASPPRSPSSSPTSGSKFRAAVHRVKAEALREYHDPYNVAQRETTPPRAHAPQTASPQTAAVSVRPEWSVSRDPSSPPRSVSPHLISPLAVGRAYRERPTDSGDGVPSTMQCIAPLASLSASATE
jgi:hypothetical protein